MRVADSLLTPIAALVAWLAWHLLHEMATELAAWLLSPVAKSFLRLLRASRWRAPVLIVSMVVGIVSVVEGYSLLSAAMPHPDAGLAMLFAGAGLFLFALVLHHETKPQSASRRLGARSDS